MISTTRNTEKINWDNECSLLEEEVTEKRNSVKASNIGIKGKHSFEYVLLVSPYLLHLTLPIIGIFQDKPSGSPLSQKGQVREMDLFKEDLEIEFLRKKMQTKESSAFLTPNELKMEKRVRSMPQKMKSCSSARPKIASDITFLLKELASQKKGSSNGSPVNKEN